MLSDHKAYYSESKIDAAFAQKALSRHWLWITGTSLLLAIAAGLLHWACFQASYQSTAKIMLDLSDQPTGSVLNPYKNQEELLNSELVLNQVAQRLQTEKTELKGLKISHFSGNVLSAKRTPETGFITLTAKANTPLRAQKLARLYLESYVTVAGPLFKKEGGQPSNMLAEQTHEADMALAALQQKITAAQSMSNHLGIPAERDGQAQQLSSLDSQIKITQADLAQKQAESTRIRQQLKIGKSSLESMMQAVAKGQDHRLNTLQDQLHDSQKDYSAKALVYAPTNPDMIRLQSKIEALKSQVTDQQIITIGHVPQSSSAATGVIKDRVRTELVSRLVLADAEATALRSRLGTLRAQYHQIQKPASHQPATSHATLALTTHPQQPKLHPTTHTQKVILPPVAPSAMAHQNLIVVAPPNLPQKPTGLVRWQVILLAALSGLVISSVAVVGQAVAKHRRLCPESIEQDLGLPIVGSIPWLTHEQWRYYRSRARLEITDPDLDSKTIQAYQDVAFNLKMRKNTLQKNALVFSQILGEKGHAVILANLGICLAQGGDRVLLIDADFRHPGLHEAFNHSLDYERGLPELINGVSELLYRKSDVQVQDVLKLVNEAVTPSGLHAQLEYLNAGLVMDSTFEFLNAKSFDVLLNVLKTDYDWVLISAPPILKAPDCAILASYVDGLLLLTNGETEASHMALAAQKIQRMGSTPFGVILRDFYGK
ncbi:GumC family protein [Vampirovibrio sp.]|uniref:GumC family protein n=1 Tax=Vampirovibrio sp. TaxID=2717857 RepID=UPI0035934A38